MKFIRFAALSCLLIFPLNAPLLAESDVPCAEPDPVFIFIRICYAQLPDLCIIRDMANLMSWKTLVWEDLAGLKQVKNMQVLEACDERMYYRIYRMGG